MPNVAVRALGALALMTSLPACAAEIGWTIAQGTDAAHVRLLIERSTLYGRDSNSRAIAAADLDGLDMHANGPVHFALRREAGTLSCEGTMSAARGTGQCSFAADPRFTDALAAHGIGRPDDAQSYALAVHDVHMALVETLLRLRFPPPSTNELVALAIHGATPDWLTVISAAHPGETDISDLIAYRIHGISGGWLQAMLAADPALRKAGGGEIVALKIHGVTPEWAQALADAGYRDIPAAELVALRIHGISPEFARAAAEMTPRPSAGELVGHKLMERRTWQ